LRGSKTVDAVVVMVAAAVTCLLRAFPTARIGALSRLLSLGERKAVAALPGSLPRSLTLLLNHKSLLVKRNFKNGILLPNRYKYNKFITKKQEAAVDKK